MKKNRNRGMGIMQGKDREKIDKKKRNIKKDKYTDEREKNIY